MDNSQEINKSITFPWGLTMEEVSRRWEEEVMPEVRRQIKVYEEAKANGNLRPLPPFSHSNKNAENGTHNTPEHL
mgnify:CR=1 FL=1